MIILTGWIPVWKRNRDVFKKLFWVNFFLPLLEPIFYLITFGFGLGNFVRDINGMPYKKFIIPAIVAMATLSSSFFYTTYSSFVKMIFQKTFDAIIATPVSIEEVVMGEIMWGATRGIISGFMVLIFLIFLGLVPLKNLFFYLLIISILSFTFSSLGMLFTSIVSTIESFNYPIFLYYTPMIFFSGTFFPITNFPDFIVYISKIIFPLTYSMISLRALEYNLNLKIILEGIYPFFHGIIFFILSIKLMKKKLIK
ncbi:MAG: ABC transporter permease [Proteobacteria bacterium]|nr:ABC transporter permease [Pseudomonadota bacterium]